MKKVKKNNSRAARSCEEILCAGFGGQGIMLMGKLLAEAGMMGGRHVTWMPSYGAEVRGGTAYSMTKISTIEIASPVVTNPDLLVVMNKPSLIKYENMLKPGGVLISNRSLIDSPSKRRDIRVVNISMTDIAAKLGTTRSANMIAVGALVRHSKTLSLRNIVNALREVFKDKEDLFIMNKKALERGYGS